jgi:hypothetical protein
MMKVLCRSVLLFTVILFNSIYLNSCKDHYGFALEVTPVKAADSYDGLLMFTKGKNVFGINPATMEKKVELHLNTFVSQPVIDSDGTMYLGDQGAELGDFGNYLFHFNKNGTLDKQIYTLGNTSNIICTDSFVLADSNCAYEGTYLGYSIVSKQRQKEVSRYLKLDWSMCNSGTQWIYDGKIFIGTGYREVGEKVRPVSFFTVDAATYTRSDPISDFTVASGNQKKFEYVLDGGALLTLYGFEYMLREYDLSTFKLLKEVSLADATSELSGTAGTEEYCMESMKVVNDEILILCRTESGTAALQKIIVVDKDSLTVKKCVALSPFDSYKLTGPFYAIDSLQNYVFFITDTMLLKYSLSDGAVAGTLAIES